MYFIITIESPTRNKIENLQRKWTHVTENIDR